MGCSASKQFDSSGAVPVAVAVPLASAPTAKEITSSRGARYVDSKRRSFIDYAEYPETKLYKSDALYYSGKDPTSYDVSHIKVYTTNSQEMNDGLLYDKVDKKKVRELDQCIINISTQPKVLEQVQKKNSTSLPGLPGHISLFRGGRMNNAEMAFLRSAWDNQTVLCTRSFLSCSLLAEVAVKFHDIHGKLGNKVLFVVCMSLSNSREFAYVRPWSTYPDEEEVVIRPYRRFTVQQMVPSTEYGAIVVVLRPNYS